MSGDFTMERVDIGQLMYDGESWCPYCRTQMVYNDDQEEFQCQTCNYSLPLEDAEDGDGYPTEYSIDVLGSPDEQYGYIYNEEDES